MPRKTTNKQAEAIKSWAENFTILRDANGNLDDDLRRLQDQITKRIALGVFEHFDRFWDEIVSKNIEVWMEHDPAGELGVYLNLLESEVGPVVKARFTLSDLIDRMLEASEDSEVEAWARILEDAAAKLRAAKG